MIVGAVMVSAVFYLTCNVINEAVTGTLHKNRTKLQESLQKYNQSFTELGKDL
jgi:hypothetical protein